MSMYRSSSTSASMMSSSSWISSVQRLRGIGTILVLLIISSVCVTHSNAEYFSSVHSLQMLGDIEMTLVDVFRQNLQMQQNEFARYQRFIEHVKVQHSLAVEDLEDYLGNPINAFTLIKRMVTDWNHLHDYVKNSVVRKEFREQMEIFGKEVEFPAENELRGAIKGLARLQRVYDLNATDLAEGEINGIYYGSELSWQECYEIATNLFDEKDLLLAMKWFEVTLIKLEAVEDDPTKEKFQIDSLEYLALASYDLGLTDEALSYIDEILVISPDHTARDTQVYIRLNGPKELPQTNVKTDFDWYANYTRLCQGIQVPEKIQHTLKCKIDNRNQPEFVLAPLRIEELSLDPEIYLYHGLLNDDQIENILDQAADNMERSSVKAETGSAVRDVRVSQQAWVSYDSPTMQTAYRLVQRISGYNLTNCETMQVANYGIGGQYDPHYDFLGEGETAWIGDRISTNMFYFSDVEQGGYTVFPKLNVYLQPVKGSLVMWNNLHRSLASDYRMMHAGCPVIKGSKRIGNIWIHSGYQEFKRPCELKNDINKSFGFY